MTMNSNDPIGGYLEMSFAKPQRTLHNDAIHLNSARSCLEYALKKLNVKKLYIPEYICGVVEQPLKRIGVDYGVYSIGDDLRMVDETVLQDSEYILIVNYFGVMSGYCEDMSNVYGNKAIFDYSQAYFDDAPAGGVTFYSPRKFFGLPDGGLLKGLEDADTTELPTGVSYSRTGHLMARYDAGPEEGYDKYQAAEFSLDEEGTMRMSRLTKAMLDVVDDEEAMAVRRANFDKLHGALGANNKLKMADGVSGPLCYPYYTDDDTLRGRLIENRIFVPTYWNEIPSVVTNRNQADKLAQSIIPIPIDQRYGEAEMQRIIDCIQQV